MSMTESQNTSENPSAYHLQTQEVKRRRIAIAAAVTLSILTPTAVLSAQTVVDALPSSGSKSERCSRETLKFSRLVEKRAGLVTLSNRLIDEIKRQNEDPRSSLYHYLDDDRMRADYEKLIEAVGDSESFDPGSIDCDNSTIEEIRHQISDVGRINRHLESALKPVSRNSQLVVNAEICEINNEDRFGVAATKKDLINGKSEVVLANLNQSREILEDAIRINQIDVENVERKFEIDDEKIDSFNSDAREIENASNENVGHSTGLSESILRCSHPDDARRIFSENTITLSEMGQIQLASESRIEQSQSMINRASDLRNEAQTDLENREAERREQIRREEERKARERAEEEARIVRERAIENSRRIQEVEQVNEIEANRRAIANMSVSELRSLLNSSADLPKGVTTQFVQDALDYRHQEDVRKREEARRQQAEAARRSNEASRSEGARRRAESRTETREKQTPSLTTLRSPAMSTDSTPSLQ